jgi:hypothetical protein
MIHDTRYASAFSAAAAAALRLPARLLLCRCCLLCCWDELCAETPCSCARTRGAVSGWAGTVCRVRAVGRTFARGESRRKQTAAGPGHRSTWARPAVSPSCPQRAISWCSLDGGSCVKPRRQPRRPAAIVASIAKQLQSCEAAGRGSIRMSHKVDHNVESAAPAQSCKRDATATRHHVLPASGGGATRKMD